MSAESWLSSNIIAIIVIVVVVGVTTFVCTIVAKLITHKFLNRRTQTSHAKNLKRSETVRENSFSDSSEVLNNFRQWYGFSKMDHAKDLKLHTFGNYQHFNVNQKCLPGCPCDGASSTSSPCCSKSHFCDGHLKKSNSDANLSQKLGLGNDNVEPFDTFMRQLEDENLSAMPQTPPRSMRGSLLWKEGLADAPSKKLLQKPKSNVSFCIKDEFNQVVGSSSGSCSIMHNKNNIYIAAEVHRSAGSSLSKVVTTDSIQALNYASDKLKKREENFVNDHLNFPAKKIFSPTANDNDVVIQMFDPENADMTPDVIPLVHCPMPGSLPPPKKRWGRPGSTVPIPQYLSSALRSVEDDPVESVLNNASQAPKRPNVEVPSLELITNEISDEKDETLEVNEVSEKKKKFVDLSNSKRNRKTLNLTASNLVTALPDDSGQLMVLASFPNNLLPDLELHCAQCGQGVKSSEMSKNGGSESTILKWLKFSSGYVNKRKNISRKPDANLPEEKLSKSSTSGGYLQLI